MKSSIMLALGLIGLGIVSGCGGGGNNNVTTVPTAHLAVTLPTGTVKPGTPFTFTVTALDAANAVVPTYVGTVQITTSDQTATLPANATLTKGAGTFTVTFGAVGSQTITASDTAGNATPGTSAAITVFTVLVSVSPANVTLNPSGTQTFTSTVTGITNTAVTFGVQEGAIGGSITAAGVYTAPPTSGIYHVIATSVADTSSSATAIVTVWTGGITTTPTGSMHNARGFYTATLLANGTALTNGKVLVAGGDSGGNVDFSGGIKGAELYDPSTGSFTTTGSMIANRYAHTATLLSSGKVLITGGVGDVLVPNPPHASNSAELYDPATGTFTATGNMTVTRAFHTATLLTDGRVLIVGGYKEIPEEQQPSVLLTAEIYNPATGAFTQTKGSMSIARTGHTATPLVNGKVLIAGGADINTFYHIPVATATAELYDPATDSFAPTVGPMHIARDHHAATLLSGGTKVLLTGGSHASGFAGHIEVQTTATAEIFDSATETFAATANMTIARRDHTATLTNSGDVLVAGGFDPTNSTLELFNPVNETFKPSGTMNSARAAHTATLLQNGETLLAGGEGESSAELYP